MHMYYVIKMVILTEYILTFVILKITESKINMKIYDLNFQMYFVCFADNIQRKLIIYELQVFYFKP